MEHNEDMDFRIENQSCWKQRSKMERRGIICLVFSVCVVIAIIVVLAIVLPQKDENEIQTFSAPLARAQCNSTGCRQAAHNITSYMDLSIDPCDDFYLFTCGKFLKETVVPEDRKRISTFTVMDDNLQNQLKTLIEEPITANELKSFTLIKNLYKVCMNTTAVEKNSMSTVHDILNDLGGWPVLDGKKWKEDKFDWKWSIFKFRKHGLDTDNFLSFNLYSDFKNSSRRLINIDQVELELDRENWLKGIDDDIIQAYYQNMVDLAVLFGADRKFAEYEVQTMITFRGQLANITLPPEERRNETALYNPMTVNEAQDRFPTINWLELLNSVLAFKDRIITGEDTIVINVPKYVSHLEKLMLKTSKRVQANHAMFQAVRSLQNYLPEKVRRLQQTFESVLYGTVTRKPRWKECMSISTDMLGIAAGSMFTRKFFSGDSRKNAIEMVDNIRKELVQILKNVTWMDDETRNTAIDKALAITADIGYADELLDDKKIEQYHEPLLNYNTDNYIYFIGNITMFKTDRTVEKVWEPVNKTEWLTRPTPITANAFYDPSENSIQLPAAILQGVFFDIDRPQAMNYGGIGQIIGHELTHGFDDEGKQFDKNGNVRDWWEGETDKAYAEKAKCFIDQYGTIKVPEVNATLNGINTQGENIADNGGLKEAYLAYQSWIARNGDEPMLPGLNYTSSQLFWISVGHVWCSLYRNESLKRDILTDSHSPPHYRVIIPLRNSEYFSKDFGCKEGSNMNPKHKCHICCGRNPSIDSSKWDQVLGLVKFLIKNAIYGSTKSTFSILLFGINQTGEVRDSIREILVNFSKDDKNLVDIREQI
ncbi:hypothetical protein RN001_008077 [Aquatica leii]|uniref:Neprilysin n=1 Tax=Aquatica leii TaxID=1421715 RepID=A0AAN7S9F2_9COLE|nr:hypothetical protein RN001_008077 [Aquatica leii]